MDRNLLKKISYRPFDERYIYYDLKLVGRAREKVMRHFILGKNVGLNWIRPMSSKYEFSIFISGNITDQCSAGHKNAGAGISYLAPLYLYPDTPTEQSLHSSHCRVPNLNMEIIQKIADGIGLSFDPNKGEGFVPRHDDHQSFGPEDLLDYIYAVLHSPTYRTKYKEFLKIDFPRVPYPKDAATFWQLVNQGTQLRMLHLMESPELANLMTEYPVDGDNIVRKVSIDESYVEEDENGDTVMINPMWRWVQVYINDTQYFARVPLDAWEFYIGGYQPAQKWLKDRKGRTLSFEDILHYQKIIVAL